MEYKHSLQPKLQFPYSKCLQKLILKSTKNMLKKTVNIKFASSHVFLKKCVELLTLAFVPYIHADKVREDKQWAGLTVGNEGISPGI